jgi:hypothetical protein
MHFALIHLSLSGCAVKHSPAPNRRGRPLTKHAWPPWGCDCRAPFYHMIAYKFPTPESCLRDGSLALTLSCEERRQQSRGCPCPDWSLGCCRVLVRRVSLPLLVFSFVGSFSCRPSSSGFDTDYIYLSLSIYAGSILPRMPPTTRVSASRVAHRPGWVYAIASGVAWVVDRSTPFRI